MQSGRDDTLEERYTIKFCSKLRKNATKTYGMLQKLLKLLAWIEHQFLSVIRDSRKAESRWGMIRGVGGVRRLSLSQTIWPRSASRHFLGLPIVQTLLPVTFAYFLSSEAVVMRQLRRWKRLWQRSFQCSHKRTSMGPLRSCWNSKTSAFQPGEISSKGTSVSCVYYQ